jgi:hypothetical protein
LHWDSNPAGVEPLVRAPAEPEASPGSIETGTGGVGIKQQVCTQFYS